MQNHYYFIVAGFFIALMVFPITPVSAADISCSLSVASIPQGGDVLINGSNYGTIPVTDVPVACGLQTIGVQMDGYANYTSTISIDEGTHQDIIANLQRLPYRGQVTIISDPPGGNLFVDGDSRGLTPITVDNLLPGRHEILIQKTGYEDYHDVLSAATDITTEYTEYLVPLPGSGFLSVTSSPDGADVSIDGSDAGKTPTSLQRISAGNHTVGIYKAGYWNFTGIVNIPGGAAVLANADLTAIPTSSTLYLDSLPQGLGIYLNDTFKGSTPATLDAVPSGDYLLEFRGGNGSSVNQSFRFMPGETHEIFADLDNMTGGSVTDNEWQYQNGSSMMNQPGWISVNTTPVIEKNYTWIANGHEATVTLDIPKDLYDYYKNQPHPTTISPDTFANYAINAKDRQFLHNLVDKLEDSSDFKSYGARRDYRNVAAFVQNIVYQLHTDPVTNQVTTAQNDYWKYPVETLADGNGDCADTAILTAALLKEMGYDVVIVIFPGNPGHAGTAVACDNCNGYYYSLNGNRYYYLETTGTGFSLGTLEEKYQTTEAQIIPF
ncbi:PEGA domain-containing protein [Methanoregula sp.]|uniref:PEGA domain-containing protein n=1 Tax=Methanoregula sp. TaxID=2052170 RepID=UPI003C712339